MEVRFWQRVVLPLVLLVALLAASGFLPAPRALAGPGGGWVKAQVVSGGCVPDPGAPGGEVCSAEVTPGSPTLYEYTPNRENVGEDFNVSADRSQHGGIRTAVSRDVCRLSGTPFKWPRGTWHYGGYWTWDKSGWHGPSRTHWAFEHKDSCTPPAGYIQTMTAPTPAPGGGGGGGEYIPGVTVTPTMPVDPLPSPTPSLVPTEPPCNDTWTQTGHLPITIQQGGMLIPAPQYDPPGQPDQNPDAFAALPTDGAATRVAPGQPVVVGFLINDVRRPYQNTVISYGDWMGGRNRFAIGIADLGTTRTEITSFDQQLFFLQSRPRIRPVSADNYGSEVARDAFLEGFMLRPGLRLVTGDTGAIFYETSGNSWNNSTNATSPFIWGVMNGVPTKVWNKPWIHTRDRAGTAYNNAVYVEFTPQAGHYYRLASWPAVTDCTPADGGEYSFDSQIILYAGDLPQPNVGILKSAPETAVRGDGIVYSLYYRNTSNGDVTGAVLTDDLPAGVTFVSADPAPSSISGRRLTWNLGTVPVGRQQTIEVRVTVDASAAGTLRNVADVTATNDTDPADNHSEASTEVPVGNIAVAMSAPPMTMPGQEFDVALSYRNDSPARVRAAMLRASLPAGVALVSTSRATMRTEQSGRVLVWDRGTVNAGQNGTITIRVRVLDDAPEALLHTGWVDSPEDSNPVDNSADARTIVVRPPAAPASFNLRIHSSFQQSATIATTSGPAFRWPSGEVLDFTPVISLGALPAAEFTVATQRVVAWSFVRSGGIAPSGAGCLARTQPTADDLANADLSRMGGCIYRYLSNPTRADMAGQGHLYWVNEAPDSMRSDVYVATPLPPGPTDLQIQVAVLSTVSENGYDVNGNGTTTDILLRSTAIVPGNFTVTLIVPADRR